MQQKPNCTSASSALLRGPTYVRTSNKTIEFLPFAITPLCLKIVRVLPVIGALTALAGCQKPAPPSASAVTPLVQSSRPETASVARPLFVESASAAGLTYRWKIEGKRPINILQGIGNGCAFLDADGDGNLDILLVGPRLALFRGDGKYQFTDITQQAGLDKFHGEFLGCAVGDFDNDGYDDIYITAHGGGLLLHNEPNTGSVGTVRSFSRSFRNVTRTAGISPQPWGTSASFVDMDNDGRLDLYIGNYVEFGPHTEPQLCSHHGIDGACGPHKYTLLKGVMYRNMGGGRFADVTRQWGMDKASGRVLGVAAGPLSPANRPALFLSNDAIGSNMMTLEGQAVTDTAKAAGTALFPDGTAFGGMGVDWGDYDGDGKLDILVATFVNQAKCVFHNDGSSFSLQDTQRIGTASSIPYVAFGAKWLDFDNDGMLDIMMANGQVQDNIAEVDLAGGPGATFRQPTVLYRNIDGTRFEDVTSRMSATARQPIVGRGLAIGDYDNDGKVDALVVDSDGSPLLLHNEATEAGHRLSVKLVGRKSNRDGFGALITAQCAARTITRHCHSDGSYFSASDRRVHLGLGAAKSIDRLTVKWPDGRVDQFANVAADREITVTEGNTSFSSRTMKSAR